MNCSIGLIRGDILPPVTSGVFENIVGQDEARSTLDFFVSSHSIATPFPTLLFTGGHGLGKTFFAKLVSKSLGRQYLEINCRNLETPDDFVEIVLKRVFQLNKPTTILLDEAHGLKNSVTDTLLSFTNPVDGNINRFLFQNVNISWDMSLINIVFATTDGYKIFDPLRNRCQEIYFYPYSEDELYRIVTGYLPNIQLQCSRKDLALTCRGRGRDAFVLSENIKRFCGNRTNVFIQNDLNKLKTRLGVMPMGLKRSEVDLLKIVADHGPISASNLAIKLMVNLNNVEEELEIRLRELGMIDSTNRGRIITEVGKKYLQQYC